MIKKNIINVSAAVNIMFCLLSLTVTILSIIASLYAPVSNQFYYYDFIIENWKLNPITELRLASNQQCEENEILLSHYQFPGTVTGCNCFHSNDFLKYPFLRSSCDQDQLLSGCKEVPPIDPRNFDYFTDPKNQTRFHLCGLQDKSYNFYEFGHLIKNCPTGYNRCGSEEQFVCTTNQKCPISQIGYQDDNQLTLNEYIDFGGGLNLWYNRESSIQMPFVETRIGEGDICKDESLLPNQGEDGRVDYVLMRQNKTNCERDPRFKFLYKISDYDFYQINNSTDLLQKLPFFQISRYNQWGLYHRGYITWKQQCKGDIFKNFLQLKYQQASIQELQQPLLIIQIVILIGIGFIFNFISFLNKNQRFQTINIILNFLSIIICFILTTVLYVKSKLLVDSVKNIANLNCSDSFTQNIIQELTDNIDSITHNHILIIFIIFLITFLFIVISGIILLKVQRIDTYVRLEDEHSTELIINNNQ